MGMRLTKRQFTKETEMEMYEECSLISNEIQIKSLLLIKLINIKKMQCYQGCTQMGTHNHCK